MSEGQPNSHRTKRPVSRWHWIVGISLLFIVAITVVGILIFNARPILRTRVVETLSARFKSKVELEAFDVSLMKGFQVSGEGLRLFGDGDPNNHEPGIQPLVAVAEILLLGSGVAIVVALGMVVVAAISSAAAVLQ